MQRKYTSHLINQAAQVAELLDQGFTNRRIAEVMGVSGPRIAQIRALIPELTPYLGRPAPLDRLRSHRDQLWLLRHQTLQLAATIRRDLRELDEELQAARVDRLLGLRAG
jgi:hypothetical protein